MVAQDGAKGKPIKFMGAIRFFNAGKPRTKDLGPRMDTNAHE